MTPATALSTRGLRAACLALIILALLGAAYNLTRRIHAERSARGVELVVDYTEVAQLASQQGLPVTEALTSLKNSGATAVALPEETLKTLEDEGLLTIDAGGLAAGGNGYTRILKTDQHADATDAAEFTIVPADTTTRDLVVQGLQRAYPGQTIIESAGVAHETLVVHGSKDAMSLIGLGLSPANIKAITASGLRVVPRLLTQDGRTPESLTASLSAIAAELPEPPGGKTYRTLVVFDGKMIPGYRDLIPQLANALTQNGLVYGSLEFGKQKGDPELGAKLHGQFVRVHSISQEELATMSQMEAVQRFGLAVKDRNIRALFVRLPALSSAHPLKAANGYVNAIAHEIRGMRWMDYRVSPETPAHPFKDVTTPGWLLLLLFAGAGASLLLWVLSILPDTLPAAYARWALTTLVLLLVVSAGAAFKMTSLGEKLFGLLAALGFPLLALTWAYRKVDRLVALPPRRILLPALGAMFISTAITLAGALLIAAMLTFTTYLVKVSQFAGVKVALSVPLVLFAALLITDGVSRAGETLADYAARCRTRLLGFFSQPLYLWVAIISVIGLAVVALMLMRSGNDSGVGVSLTELKIRAILDRLMIARPRTKEFAFGVPFFLFAMVAAANRKRTLALVLLLGAAIGQLDVLNTYCHAHTPVLLSLLRTFNGLWLGVVIGVALLILFARRSLRPGQAKQPVAE
jgi:hypothetical protein